MLRRIIKSKNSYTYLLIVVLALLSVIMSFFTPYFLTAENLKNVLNMSSLYVFLTIGMAFVIISGQIDLSVGAILGFTGMIVSNLLYIQVNPYVSILVGLICATLLGALNGWLVAYLRINSFIVTLCTMTVMRGVILLVMNSKSRYGFGEVLGFIGAGQIGRSKVLNMPILMALIAVAISIFVMNKTKFGSYTKFLGSNEVALSRSGINTHKFRVAVFALSGLLAGIAGVIVMGRLDSAQPLAGQGYEMDAIAAVILGGVLMDGGKGNIGGPFVACIILSAIKAGLTLIGISFHYQEIITGIIIVISVLLSGREESRKREV